MVMDAPVDPQAAAQPARLVAAEIRAEMARQRRSGVELAKHLGLSQPTISRRLVGDLPFDLEELFRIADWLGVNPSDLFPTKRTDAVA